MSPDIPLQVVKQGERAEALQRQFIESGAYKGRRVRNMPTCSLMITAPLGKGGRRNPVLLRRLHICLRSVVIKPGKGNKPNLQLLAELADWLLTQSKQTRKQNQNLPTPRRSLAAYQDEGLLAILQRHRQVDASVLWWDDISKESLRALEKRLYHHWKLVERLAFAFKEPTNRATNSRRKLKTAFQHMVFQMKMHPIF